ncbi:LacI family DNA-binding transcriptional regulator [Futiania mangrovi]|uniref:LacI family transcriptional regulator n=1 Tax=Futiania mangrovi TaxID=2959716 RepID=A0A9J6PM83_9PROT|nr:LacI family DNA-binding transcriptional regulator [Futiania mangrovii]MCP1337154.1 LacI family transcriptional regulator [Futiania mangrovii]
MSDQSKRKKLSRLVPTVRDVAKRAGVSPATVSRALGDKAVVSPELRQRVQDAANALGYRPNAFARGLREGRSRIVALLVGDIEQSHFSSLTKHVQKELSAVGTDLLLHDLEHREDRLMHILRQAPALQLNGIVLASSDTISSAAATEIAAARNAGIPIVAAGQDLTWAGVPSVTYNERAAARHSVGQLLALGGAPCAYVGRVQGSAVGTERHRGYCDAHEAAGAPRDAALTWDVAYRYSAGRDAVNRALREGIAFRSIQAGSDELAMGALAALTDHGLRVPRDVRLVGFGNVEMSAHLRPALTTLSSHAEEMARCIHQALDSQWQGQAPQELVMIERGLVQRQSS